MNFEISVFVSQNIFQFKLLLTITSVMLRNSHFGLKMLTLATLTSAQVIIFFWKLMNSFLRNCLEIPLFFNAQIRPKHLGFVASDLAYAGYNPEGGMHFL